MTLLLNKTFKVKLSQNESQHAIAELQYLAMSTSVTRPAPGIQSLNLHRVLGRGEPFFSPFYGCVNRGSERFNNSSRAIRLVSGKGGV